MVIALIIINTLVSTFIFLAMVIRFCHNPEWTGSVANSQAELLPICGDLNYVINNYTNNYYNK